REDVVDVDAAALGRKVPDDFLGLSVEWDQVAGYLGDGKGHARSSVVKLLRAFSDEGHMPPVRIGGNSEDIAWWNDPNAQRPADGTLDIGATEIATLASLRRGVGTSLVRGLNIRTADAANAAMLVGAALAAIPRSGILAFSL